MYSKGHPYPAYPGYIMMGNMNNDSYMNNGSLSPPMARTVSTSPFSASGSTELELKPNEGGKKIKKTDRKKRRRFLIPNRYLRITVLFQCSKHNVRQC